MASFEIDETNRVLENSVNSDISEKQNEMKKIPNFGFFDTKENTKPYNINIPKNNRKGRIIDPNLHYSDEQKFRIFKTKIEPKLLNKLQVTEDNDMVKQIKKAFGIDNKEENPNEITTSTEKVGFMNETNNVSTDNEILKEEILKEEEEVKADNRIDHRYIDIFDDNHLQEFAIDFGYDNYDKKAESKDPNIQRKLALSHEDLVINKKGYKKLINPTEHADLMAYLRQHKQGRYPKKENVENKAITLQTNIRNHLARKKLNDTKIQNLLG